MTSSNGNIFRVTGPLCGEFTGPGDFTAQRRVTRSFDVSFDLRLNKRLSKQPWGWWFETPAWSLWRHRNDGQLPKYYLHMITTQRQWRVFLTPTLSSLAVYQPPVSLVAAKLASWPLCGFSKGSHCQQWNTQFRPDFSRTVTKKDITLTHSNAYMRIGKLDWFWFR